MKTAFDWPSPPYFTFAPGNAATGKESSVVNLLDGDKALGAL